MNWIDIAIVILVIYQMAAGYRKGFAGSLLDLSGIAAASVIALTQFGLVSDFLVRVTGVSSGWLNWCSLFACLGLSLALANAVTGAVGRSLRGASKSFLNSLTGFLLGGARGCVIASLLLILYVFIPFSGSAGEQLERSSLAQGTLSIVPSIVDSVMNRVDPGSPPLMDELERYFRSTQRTGMVIDDVRPGGPAAGYSAHVDRSA